MTDMGLTYHEIMGENRCSTVPAVAQEWADVWPRRTIHYATVRLGPGLAHAAQVLQGALQLL